MELEGINEQEAAEKVLDIAISN